MFDIAYLRSLPSIVVAAPRDESQLVHLLHTGIVHDGPFAVRYPRGEGTGVPLPTTATAVPIGRGELLRRGERVAILGYGSGVGVGLEAAAILSDAGHEVTVADARFAKPLDLELLRELAAGHELLVTVEEGVLAGGFGSAVWEGCEQHGIEWATSGQHRILRVGLPDAYVTHGKPAQLHAEVGFTGAAVAERIAAAIGASLVA